MKLKPVFTRLRADEDIDRTFEYYLQEDGPRLAEDFINELERTTSHLSRSPLSGSPRLETALAIPGLRHWAMRRFPYVIFYVDREAFVEIWRVLHGHTDIPAGMRDEDQ